MEVTFIKLQALRTVLISFLLCTAGWLQAEPDDSVKKILDDVTAAIDSNKGQYTSKELAKMRQHLANTLRHARHPSGNITEEQLARACRPEFREEGNFNRCKYFADNPESVRICSTHYKSAEQKLSCLKRAQDPQVLAACLNVWSPSPGLHDWTHKCVNRSVSAEAVKECQKHFGSGIVAISCVTGTSDVQRIKDCTEKYESPFDAARCILHEFD